MMRSGFEVMAKSEVRINKIEMKGRTNTVLCVFVSWLGLAYGGLLYRHTNLPQYSPESLNKIMDNSRILMIGDSLMRYHYLTLVHLIHLNSFPDTVGNDKLLLQRKFETWPDFYAYAKNLFAPNEFCDCDHVNEINLYIENRYYHNPARNISLYYVQYFGERFPFHGKFIPNRDAAAGTAEMKAEKWMHANITELLSNITPHFHPRPTVLLLNAGIHMNHYGQATHRDAVVAAALKAFPRVIWKTSNVKKELLGKTIDRTIDAAMCAYPQVECMDLSWTQYLSPSDYADDWHFEAPSNVDVTLQFLELLRTEKRVEYTPPLSCANRIVQSSDIANTPIHYPVDPNGLIRPLIDPIAAAAVLRDDCGQRHCDMPMEEMLTHITGGKVGDRCAVLRKQHH